MTSRYGISFHKNGLVSRFRDTEGHVAWGMIKFAYYKYGLYKLAGSFLAFLRLKKLNPCLSKIGLYHCTDPELYLTIIYFFRVPWLACGYTNYASAPALYVIKGLSTMVSKFSVIEFLLFCFFENIARQNAMQGFQEIWIRVANDLKNVRLSSPVEQVVRRIENDKPVIEVTASGTTGTYDRLIITCDLRIAAQFLDSNATEQSLFGLVKSEDFDVHLSKVSGCINLPAKGSVDYFDQYATLDADGHAINAVTLAGIKDIVMSYHHFPPNMSEGNRLVILKEGLTLICNATFESTILKVAWDYYSPYVDAEALNQGFHQNLEALQGQRGTYYAGSIFNLDGAEETAEYSKDMVYRSFK